MADEQFRRFLDLTAGAQRKERAERIGREGFGQGRLLPEATLDSVPESVRAAFRTSGWAHLLPVQSRTIPYVLAGRDVVVQSRTGSGKTGAFLLPLFDTLLPGLEVTQALVLTPTRELARQVHTECRRLATGTGIRSTAVYGGVGYEEQTQRLTAGSHVVVGTPGRIIDHLFRGTFHLEELRVFILDEADEMLSMGFYPAMVQLKEFLPLVRQSYMFSATMPPKVQALGQEFLRDPVFLGLSADGVSVEAIEHRYYRVGRMDKDRALARLIELENPDAALIFANTKREVEYIHQFLVNYGYDAAELTGDMPQRHREKTMERFRQRRLRFLVATDVAARGIDISELSHVFQYDVPLDPEYYIHRTGRTARAGRAGTAITLSTIEDERRLVSIASTYDIEMMKRSMPTEADVARRVAERMTEVLEERMRARSNLERERLQRFLPMVEELVQEQPELLAMLVDDLYHDRMQEGVARPRKKQARRKR